MTTRTTLFSDFLKVLGVPHTAVYSDRRFGAMPFETMFGLSKVLESYGVPNEGLKIADKNELSALTAPFIADTPEGFVIVTWQNADSVSYLSQGEPQTMARADFLKAWNGIVLLAYPDQNSREPDYGVHHVVEIADKVKTVALWAIGIALFAYLFVTNGIWRHVSTVAMAAVDIVGLYMSFLLVQKSLKIKNKAADKVCGILEEGGCDSILEMKASSFFGIFKWSEVGFAYFSVSLAAMLIFPEWLPYLALCNACCLPFTVWSIWYQKFRAGKWCTMCFSVQLSLWLLFFCYFFGGWYDHALLGGSTVASSIFPLRIEFFVLALSYAVVLLILDRLTPAFDRHDPSEEDL